MSVVHLFKSILRACCKRCVPQLSFGMRSTIATPTAAGNAIFVSSCAGKVIANFKCINVSRCGTLEGHCSSVEMPSMHEHRIRGKSSLFLNQILVRDCTTLFPEGRVALVLY